MFNCEQEPLSLLLELTPKLAKKRYRQSIYDAWNHKCGYCEEQATSLDHIIPRFRSGSSNRNNLLPCCKRCNANKASLKMEEWYEQQEYFSAERYTKIQAWVNQEVIDLFVYNMETEPSAFAAG